MDVNLLARSLETFAEQEADFRSRAERLAKIIRYLKDLYPAEVAQIPKLAIDSCWVVPGSGVPGPVAGIEPGGIRINGHSVDHFPGVCAMPLDPAADAKIESALAGGGDKPKESPPSVAGQARAGRKNKTSQYHGVSLDRRRAKSDKPWKTSVWDKKRRKAVNLGYFATEESAAAAVQKYLGNLAEAQSLADMAEQAENNPDRQKRRRKEKADIPAGSIAWECNKCGLQWVTDNKPEWCANCGCESLIRIKADGSGEYDYRRPAPDE